MPAAPQSRMFAKLPPRFQWTFHNLVAHPLGEIIYQAGGARKDGVLTRLADWLHDATVPVHDEGTGRG